MSKNIINMLTSIVFILVAVFVMNWFLQRHIDSKIDEARDAFNAKQLESIEQSIENMNKLNEKIDSLSFELQKSNDKLNENNERLNEEIRKMNSELEDVKSSNILKNTIGGLQK